MSQRLKAIAREIFAEALAACTVKAAVERWVSVQNGRLRVVDRNYDLQSFSDVRIVSIGKAGAALFDAVRPLLQEAKQVRAVISAPAAPYLLGELDRFFAGGHPLPNSASLASAQAAIELLRGSTDRTLVLFLISGGASSMFEAPLSPAVTLDDLLVLNRRLVGSGAPIAEINCVRKHLSAVKGGRLLKMAVPATCVSLLVSDVPADKLDAVGSGPSLPDWTTVSQCLVVVEKFLGGPQSLPRSVSSFLLGGLPETPKPSDPVFARAQNHVLLDNAGLLEGAQEAAERRGFRVVVDTSCDDWDYRDAAEHLLCRLQELVKASQPVCLLSGGEVTVRLPERPGTGGRNLQWCLYCASRLPESGLRATVLSAGSDGIDGVSPAAGGVADETSWEKARVAGLEPAACLREFGAYDVFERLKDHIVIGPTGNNVRDLRALFWNPGEQ